MGSKVIATCDCGLSEGILIGGGMLNFTTTCLFPCCCKSCNNVVEVNLLFEDMKCPQCGSKDVIPYDNPSMVKSVGNELIASWNKKDELGRVLEITNGSYWCPKCKRPTLKFEDGGLLWD